jgi:hypothetical protein
MRLKLRVTLEAENGSHAARQSRRGEENRRARPERQTALTHGHGGALSRVCLFNFSLIFLHYFCYL